ncbi:hypothetical protein NSA50_19250 [Clostridium sp. DSM 100503]|uniref:hypothetical protein n=1 Tax=Clostridium sp. DSM 100503 TaxID=2963282 RepID=UPI00214A79AC|nr:hypothetical protein [Clostridium sp. DSM 100503]MCR1953097.1 hypothetical protein [Clostridium sp. DSM 100503]MCR1953131.1 hypothetical protein [Clostridium sp. DSM 100503]
MNFGQNILEVVQTNVMPLFLAVLVCVAIYFLVKREMTKFVAFLAMSVVVAGFVVTPETVRDILVNLFKSIFRV